MTQADLMRGDAPWRLALRFHPLSGPQRAAWAFAAVILVATAALLPGGLWALLTALWAWVGLRPVVWVVGGGRRPLASAEWRHWMAHFDLTKAEHEHEAKKAKNRG